MRKGIFLLGIYCLTITIPLFAKEKTSIHGQVLDKNNSPIEFGNIILRSNDKIIASALTNNEGYFDIKTDSIDNLLLEIRFIGYKTKTINITEGGNLGKITLLEDEKVLNEVTVTDQKNLIEKKADRLVFNTQNISSLSGGNAIDVLEVTPRIKVKNGTVSIIGKGTVTVMIDDRPIQLSGEELTSFLETLSADNIASIEVISNPPAKYQADGNGGLINIVSKQTKEKTWSSTINTTFTQATKASSSSAANLNWNHNKLKISSNIKYTNRDVTETNNSLIHYTDSEWKVREKNRLTANYLSATINSTYQINSKLKTGASYYHSTIAPTFYESNDTQANDVTNNNNPNSIITTTAEDDRKYQTNDFNWHLVYLLDTATQSSISFDFNILGYSRSSHRDFIINPNSGVTTTGLNAGDQNILNHSYDLDLELPFSSGHINFGGRYSSSSTKSSFESTGTDQNILDRFEYSENVGALYGSLGHSLSSKIELQIGLRLEHTQTSGNSIASNEDINRNYTQLFPSGVIEYELNENNSLSLDYGRRIERPKYFYFNPFRWIDSPFSFIEGNPFLQPAYTHNMELVHAHKQILFSTLYYSHTENDYLHLTRIDESSNVVQSRPENFFDTRTIGINQMLQFKPTKWWRLTLSTDTYYSTTTSDFEETRGTLEGWNFDPSINSDVLLSPKKTVFLNLSYNYVSRGVDGLERNSAYSQLNAALKIKTFEKRLTVTLYGNDLLRTLNPTYTNYSNNIKNTLQIYSDTRYFRITALWKIGGKTKGIDKRNKNETELNRIK